MPLMKDLLNTAGGALSVAVFDMVLGLSQAMDLISPAVVDHHKRVAYIADAIAGACGLPLKERADVLLAGLMHDCGALSLSDRLQVLEFEAINPQLHAETGWLLLHGFPPFAAAAELIRHHHSIWSKTRNKVPLGAHILHLADRVDVLTDRHREPLNQAASIRRRIRQESGGMFMPELVEAFLNLSHNEYFWLDASSRAIDTVLARKADLGRVALDADGLGALGQLFSRLIDFRSRFTATHTAGVAATAEALALAAGLDPDTAQRLLVAGYLHDLGKLAVPAEILEKPARLTAAEFNVVKKHTFWSYRILENIAGLGELAGWAAYHHEKLDGRGYPFHRRAEELPLPARIMSVADVFTALTEDRPYRKGTDAGPTLDIMRFMVRRKALDGELVDLLAEKYGRMWEIRREAQARAASEYQQTVIPFNRPT
jgi:HD-GYP domain-containing protein (c-di-GMP phosphodiesterase class II)